MVENSFDRRTIPALFCNPPSWRLRPRRGLCLASRPGPTEWQLKTAWTEQLKVKKITESKVEEWVPSASFWKAASSPLSRPPPTGRLRVSSRPTQSSTVFYRKIICLCLTKLQAQVCKYFIFLLSDCCFLIFPFKMCLDQAFLAIFLQNSRIFQRKTQEILNKNLNFSPKNRHFGQTMTIFS